MLLLYAYSLDKANTFRCPHQKYNPINMHDVYIQADIEIVLDDMRWNISDLISVWHLTWFLCSVPLECSYISLMNYCDNPNISPSEQWWTDNVCSQPPQLG